MAPGRRGGRRGGGKGVPEGETPVVVIDDDDGEEPSDDEALLEVALRAMQARLAGGDAERPRAGPATREEEPEGGGRGDASLGEREELFMAVTSVKGSASELTAEAAAALRKETAWQPDTGLPTPQGRRAEVEARGAAVRELPPRTRPGELAKKAALPSLDARKEARTARATAPKTAGSQWFDLPAPTMTPELKRDLRLIKLRGAMDPKRFYKAPDTTKLPTHFAIGTVIEGPTEFYSSRLTRREQRTSITAELLADDTLTAYRKRKYREVQEKSQSGGRKHYKKVKNMRKPSWAKH